MSNELAAGLAARLTEMGFSQTDIARGLGMTAKGSGSYVGQVLKGAKGGRQLDALRKLVQVAEAAPAVPAGRGRAATAERQQILRTAPIQKTPRVTSSGRTPKVRRKNWQVLRTKSGRLAMDAFAGEAELKGPGGGRGSTRTRSRLMDTGSGSHGEAPARAPSAWHLGT